MRANRIRGWRRIRLRILERDGWRCTRCGRAGRLEVHHRRPLHEGGHPTDPANLATVCRDCHLRAHRRPRDPAREAWRRLVDAL